MYLWTVFISFYQYENHKLGHTLHTGPLKLLRVAHWWSGSWTECEDKRRINEGVVERRGGRQCVRGRWAVWRLHCVWLCVCVRAGQRAELSAARSPSGRRSSPHVTSSPCVTAEKSPPGSALSRSLICSPSLRRHAAALQLFPVSPRVHLPSRGQKMEETLPSQRSPFPGQAL